MARAVRRTQLGKAPRRRGPNTPWLTSWLRVADTYTRWRCGRSDRSASADAQSPCGAIRDGLCGANRTATPRTGDVTRPPPCTQGSPACSPQRRGENCQAGCASSVGRTRSRLPSVLPEPTLGWVVYAGGGGWGAPSRNALCAPTPSDSPATACSPGVHTALERRSTPPSSAVAKAERSIKRKPRRTQMRAPRYSLCFSAGSHP